MFDQGSKWQAYIAAIGVALGMAATMPSPAHADTLGAQPAEMDQALIQTDIQLGQGATAQEGMRLTVHYTGWLYDAQAPMGRGRKFDSSLDRKQPFQFVLGEHRVITGWELGVQGMKVGGVRRLNIGPDLAYGERGAGGVIPPGARLVFEVKLLAAEPM
jgi:FKBP-type peptidyl-prolyl cis-trans isomerase